MDYKEKYEEVIQAIPKYIKSFAMDAVVVLVAVAYIFYQMVTLEPTNLNPLVLIAGAIISIICGVVIKQALGENGFSRGYNSKTWNDEESLYNDACNAAIPYMEFTDNFYQYEIIEKKKAYRRQHLQEVRLKYDDWFDKDGNYIEHTIIKKKKGVKANQGEFILDFTQRRVLKKCVKVRIYPLNLFSQYTVSTDQYSKPEMTDSKKRTQNTTKNTISAVLIAIVGNYFMPLIKNWSWASFVSATMQVTLWVLFGIIQLYTNFNYVVQDKVAILRTKKEEISRFTSGCEKHLYDRNPYDEQPEVKEEHNGIKFIAPVAVIEGGN